MGLLASVVFDPDFARTPVQRLIVSTLTSNSDQLASPDRYPSYCSQTNMTDLRDDSTPPAYSEEDTLALFEPHSSGGGERGGAAGRRLARPVAVPQTGGAYDSPFARAWAPALAAQGISRDDWLAFVDGLNVAM